MFSINLINYLKQSIFWKGFHGVCFFLLYRHIQPQQSSLQLISAVYCIITVFLACTGVRWNIDFLVYCCLLCASWHPEEKCALHSLGLYNSELLLF